MTYAFLIPLLTAHFVADFLLQSDQDAAQKHRPLRFLKHLLLHALMVYLFVGDWTSWRLVVLVTVAHGIIDLGKLTLFPLLWRRPSTGYLVDQILHFISLMVAATLPAAWLGLGEPWWQAHALEYLGIILALGASIAVTRGASFYIELFLQPWAAELRRVPPKVRTITLSDAGVYIGYLERLLILTFVAVGQPAAVTFLVVAKSVFRFHSIRDGDARQAEFIIVGSLLSYATGLILALSFGALWGEVWGMRESASGAISLPGQLVP